MRKKKGMDMNPGNVLLGLLVLGLVAFVLIYMFTNFFKGTQGVITGQLCDSNSGLAKKVRFDQWRAEGDCPCDDYEAILHHYTKNRVVGAVLDKEKVSKDRIDTCGSFKYVCFMEDEYLLAINGNCFPIPKKGADFSKLPCGNKYVSEDWQRQEQDSGTDGISWKDMKMYKGAGKDVITEYCVEDAIDCKAHKDEECKKFFAAQEREMKEENNGGTI